MVRIYYVDVMKNSVPRPIIINGQHLVRLCNFGPRVFLPRARIAAQVSMAETEDTYSKQQYPMQERRNIQKVLL